MTNIKDKVTQDKRLNLEQIIREFESSLFILKEDKLYKIILEVVEKPMIEAALERTDGNQFKAARLLGINRNTLHAKIKKLGIEVRRWKRL